jgi:hypothetical protein
LGRWRKDDGRTKFGGGFSVLVTPEACENKVGMVLHDTKHLKESSDAFVGLAAMGEATHIEGNRLFRAKGGAKF